MQLPFSLVRAMPESVHQMLAERSGYEDKLRLLDSEVAGIFDPVVDSILEVGWAGPACSHQTMHCSIALQGWLWHVASVLTHP
jgi:hypothetical protein